MKHEDKKIIAKIIESSIIDNSQEYYIPSKDSLHTHIDFMGVVELLLRNLNIQIKYRENDKRTKN